METQEPVNQSQEATPTQPEGEEKVVHELGKEDQGWGKAIITALIIILIITVGGVSGYFLSRGFGRSSTGAAKKLTGNAEVVSGSTEVGIKDEKVFRDTASGRLETNDFSKVKEGSHKLIRPGGENQTAYLTSSVVDLDQFSGKCVQVWGETFSSQTAGWLMDVGRVKILDNCPEGL